MSELKVLIVDDEFGVRNAINKTIQRKYPGFAVFEATNGFVAGMMLEKENIDILFLDIKLPGMDGFEIMEQIRKERRFDALNIIIMTGYLEDAVEGKVKTFGVRKLLIKPFSIYEIKEIIDDIIKPVQ